MSTVIKNAFFSKKQAEAMGRYNVGVSAIGGGEVLFTEVSDHHKPRGFWDDYQAAGVLNWEEPSRHEIIDQTRVEALEKLRDVEHIQALHLLTLIAHGHVDMTTEEILKLADRLTAQ